MRKLLILTAVLAAALPAWAAEPDPAGPLTVAEAMVAPRAPLVRVVDTESSLGPLAGTPRTVTLEDLVRYHGHPCDGLVVAAVGLAHGLAVLFPEGVVDRTDLEVAVNGSACYGDVAAYLTGARHRYGTLVVDPKLGDEWILHRRSTGATLRVRLRDGVKPAALPRLEAELRAADCPAGLVAEVQAIQRSYALAVLSRPAGELFTVKRLDRYPYADGQRRPDAAKASCTAGTAGLKTTGGNHD